MKKKLKKYGKVFMSVALIVSTLLQSVSSSFAAEATLDRDTSMTSYVREIENYDNLGGYHAGGGKRVFKIGSSYAYCLESDVGIESPYLYEDTDNVEDVLSNGRQNVLTTYMQKYYMISALLTLLPSTVQNDNKTEHIHWLVGQVMIWEITGEERAAGFVYNGVTRAGATAYRDVWEWTYDADKAEFESFYKEVEAKMLSYWKIPSFSASRESLASTYDLDTYSNGTYSVTLTDTNNVLANFDFSANGLSFSKNGNQLTVSSSSSFSGTITVSATPSDLVGNVRAPVFWTSGSKQKLCTATGELTDPSLFAYFKVQIGVGNVEITKQDNYGNYIAGTTFKLSYNADMSNAIGTYTTGSDGKVTISGLKIGTVYIQETAVPDNLILDETVHNVSVTAGKTVTYTATNQWKQGYIQVTKKDDKTKEVVKKAGTQFEILSDSTVVATITTDENGVAKSGLLDYGTYTVREKTNPENYVIVTTTASTSILEDGKTYTLEMYDTPVTGTINLSKVDSETGKTAQGDATLVGAKYALIANENILNPSDGSILYAKDEVISVKTIGEGTWGDIGNKVTDADGNIAWTNLPMGEYRIEETDPPTGYLADENHTVTLTSTSNTQSVEVKDVESAEDVIKGRLQVVKSGNDGSAGVIDGLAGVEFTMKLYSEVQEVGWDEAKTYSVFTTDSTGRGISDEVPYGVYLVSETYTPANYSAGGDFFVTIDEDGEVEFRIVNNTPFEAWLKIVKQDEDGNIVTLSNATFKIKDSEGNYVKQKVGLFFYKDEWTTDENGMVALDNMLLQGDYTIEEVKSPEGFLLADEVSVSISTDNPNLSFDEDDDPVITVYVTDVKPTGTIVIEKSFENLLDDIEASATFRLTAITDVIDPTDGSIIYNAGDVVNIGDAQDGLYTTDENGQIIISGLPLGTTGAAYQLEEVSTIDGYKLLAEPLVFEFTIRNNTTTKYLIEKSVENKLTETYFSKTDIAGDEIEGAQLSLYDNTADKLVDEWTSTTEDHLIKGLIYGHEYTLTEDLTPVGYVKAEAITFTYSQDVEKISMIDKVVSVSKLDANGKDISGALLQIIDVDTGEIVDEWTSNGTVHYANNLVEGKSYILHEEKAPEGFVTAKDVEFTVTTEKENQIVEMHDKQVFIKKLNLDDEYIEGAVMQIIDVETGEVVEEWTTTDDVYTTQNLIEGKDYILHQEVTPEPYVTAEDIPFHVEEDHEDQTIIMIDPVVVVTKTDLVNGEPVIGAELTVTDLETGEVVDSWITNENPHYICNLKEGKEYELKEVSAPYGYEIAESIVFTTTKNKQKIEIEMKDAPILTDIQVNKVDSQTGEAIVAKDFAFGLYADEDCTELIAEVHANTKDGTATFEQLRYGTYYIKEIEAPTGYQLSDEVIKVIIDENLEGVGNVYSFEYQNSLLPAKTVTVYTGDANDMLAVSALSGASLITILYLLRKKKADE